MLTEKETALLWHLRKDARKSLARISKETKIPTSTLFDVLKRLEDGPIIRHVSLVDFSKIGYSLKVNFLMSSKKKNELREYLMQHNCVNSLHSVTGEHNFYAECIFRDLKEMIEFKESLTQFTVTSLENFFVVDDIKREGFGVGSENSQNINV
jgi:DNA-binding Lrp family transcriptional regulator